MPCRIIERPVGQRRAQRRRVTVCASRCNPVFLLLLLRALCAFEKTRAPCGAAGERAAHSLAVWNPKRKTRRDLFFASAGRCCCCCRRSRSLRRAAATCYRRRPMAITITIIIKIIIIIIIIMTTIMTDSLESARFAPSRSRAAGRRVAPVDRVERAIGAHPLSCGSPLFALAVWRSDLPALAQQRLETVAG